MPRKQPRHGKPAEPDSAVPPESDRGEGLDEAVLGQQILTGVLDVAHRLVEKGCTPLDAEAWASEMLGMIGLAVTDPASVDRTFRTVLVPMIEQASSPEGLAVLRAVAAVGSRDLRAVAAGAADRLVGQGVAEQPWAATIGTPTVGDAWVYGDALGAQESLLISFAYGGRRHALCVLIDHTLGGGVKEAFVVDDVPTTLQRIAAMQDVMPEMLLEQVDPAEAGSKLRRAIEAGECPALPEQADDVASTRALLHARLRLLPSAGQSPQPELRSIHQIKVALRGSKPPIWRRLQVPSDIRLARLHDVIQAAFGWEDRHLHVFETDNGSFAAPDADLDEGDEEGVTIAAVAPVAGDRFTYRYDLGDDWEHLVTVEKIEDADLAAEYPRCAGGRRAGPPEDSGGMPGYARLLEAVADPGHPEHDDLADWLAQTISAGFDPAAFDLNEVNARLTVLRRR